MNTKIDSKNQSMVDKSEQSRASKTGFKSRGNTAVEEGTTNTKGKR